MKAIGRVVLVAVFLLAIVVGAFHLNPILNQEKLPFVWLIPPFALFSFLHASYLLGWKRAGVFFGVSAVLSMGSELMVVQGTHITGDWGALITDLGYSKWTPKRTHNPRLKG